MADRTAIEWTDATWNPITGCSVVSPGCTNCYAMRLAGTRLRHHPSRAGLTRETKAGPVWNGTVRLNEQWLLHPLRWQRGRRIFVCAHGDLFHESVPDAWIDQVFAVMALAPQHTFQVLTKRPERMRQYLAGPWSGDNVATRIADATWPIAPTRAHLPQPPTIIELPIGPRLASGEPQFGWGRALNPPAWPLPNVWLGVSVEDQARADERIPHLLATPAAVRFLSCEPLLEAVRIRDHWLIQHHPKPSPRIDWVIAGGESGPSARPSHPDWFRSVRDQCVAAGVPFFFKQWGEWITEADSHARGIIPRGGFEFADVAMARAGKDRTGAELDGREWREFPP